MHLAGQKESRTSTHILQIQHGTASSTLSSMATGETGTDGALGTVGLVPTLQCMMMMYDDDYDGG